MQQVTGTEQETWQRYHEIFGRRASKAMAAKARSGDLPGCAPVGYRNVRDAGKSWVEIDEQMSLLIKRAFGLATEGSLSLRKILEIVTDEGLRSRNGKPMGVSALYAVLTNPFYTGRLRYKDKVLQGNQPPIIGEDLFMQVQRALNKRRRR
jgi:site-specific DNA recombinase